MRTRFTWSLLGLCLWALLVPAWAWAGAAAQTGTAAHSVSVRAAWIRVLPGTLPAAGYATLVNAADQGKALIGADSPAYASVTLHQSGVMHGMSGMHAVSSLPIPAHGTAQLAPGGYHLMLQQATHPVQPGDEVPIRLHFADGSTRTVDFLSRPANANSATD